MKIQATVTIEVFNVRGDVVETSVTKVVTANDGDNPRFIPSTASRVADEAGDAACRMLTPRRRP